MLNEFGFSSNSREVGYSDDFDDDLVVLSARPLMDAKVKMLFGMREWTGEEKEFIERNNVLNFSMRKITMDGLGEVLDHLLEEAISWRLIDSRAYSSIASFQAVEELEEGDCQEPFWR